MVEPSPAISAGAMEPGVFYLKHVFLEKSYYKTGRWSKKFLVEVNVEKITIWDMIDHGVIQASFQLGEGKQRVTMCDKGSPMTSSDAETDLKPIIIIYY